MNFSVGSAGSGGNWETNAHGSARWMNSQEAAQLDLYVQSGKKDSILIGQNSKGEPAFLNRQGHILVLAPPRSGKGIGFVLPNLFCYGGSMVVTDPKGENAAVSYKARKDWQNVVILDPTQKLASYGIDPTIPTHGFNPLSVFDNASYIQVVDDIERIADALLVSKEGEKEQHWRDGARTFLKGLLTYLVFFMSQEERNLITLSRLANGIEVPHDDLFLALVHNPHPEPIMRDVITKSGAFWDKVNVKERASFVSIALRSLSWLNSPVWHNHLKRSDFHPYDLKAGKTTVYIVCPFEKLEDYSPWFRLVLSSCIVAVLRAPKRSDVPTLFMLDEYAATIGRLAALEHAVPYIEGVGGRFAMIFQYLSQMQKLWPDPEFHGIFASAGAHLFFNVNDKFTSEYVSSYIGKYGAMTPSGNTTGYIERSLLTPDEVRTLPPDDMIAFIRGYRPAWLEKFNILNSSASNSLSPNPTYFVLPEQPKSIGSTMPLLNASDAIARSKGQTQSLTLGHVAETIHKKYPGKDFRYEGDFYGYDDFWHNPATGQRERVFMPVLHTSLINAL